MTRQQHQHPSQGTSSLPPQDGDRREAPSQAAQQAPSARGDHAPSDHGMNTDHRASHVSSTDSDRFGSHASMGGIDERGSEGGAAQSMGHGGASSGSPENPQASPAHRQPTRGGAQTGLTGSISQLEHGQSQGGSEHAGSSEKSSSRQSSSQQSRSKYSPTANEQDRLSQQQGGESLREGSERPQASDGARAESSQFAQPPGGSSGSSDAMDQSTRSSVPRVERSAAAGAAEAGQRERRSPRQGPQSDNDSPMAAPAAPRGKQTATHDIDLAGPERSGTRRDR
jgi:hypothetical protein